MAPFFPLRSLVVVATIVAAAFVGYSAIPASWFLSTTTASRTIEGIAEGIRNINARRATAAERQTFVEASKRQLAKIVPLLEQQASDDQAARELVYAARDCLPKMMDATSDSDSRQAVENRFAIHLMRVKRVQARKSPKQSFFDATTIGIVLLEVVIVVILIRVFKRP